METNLSANTLFHFTTSKNTLLNILERGIYVRYCLENYEELVEGDAEIVIPMACFCDIPLSQAKRHKDTYGEYAIGLTKAWGMKHKINPVIYTYRDSSTSELLSELSNELGDFFQIVDKELPKRGKYTLSQTLTNNISNKIPDKDYLRLGGLHEKLGHFIRYIKPYEGKFYRGGDYLKKLVRFYEEREWRYLPPKDVFKHPSLKDSYKAEYYKDPIKRRAINIKLAKHVKLNFSPEDVRFIIVKTDKEIPLFLKDMEKIYADTISANSLKLLGTRLISFEQIIQDL